MKAKSQIIGLLGVGALAAAPGLALATGAVQPKTGEYGGNKPGSITVSGKSHRQISNYILTCQDRGAVKAGFRISPGKNKPIPISGTGKFSFHGKVSSLQGPPITVTISGRFSSATKVSGTIKGQAPCTSASFSFKWLKS